MDSPAGYARLRALMAEHRPDLVAVDSLIRVHGANENDAGQMADVFASVKALMREFGAAVWFNDHSRKRSLVSNDPEEMLRGSIKKRAWADTILYVAPGADGTATISHTKARYAERLPDFALRLRVADGAATLTHEGAAETGAAGGKVSDVVAAIRAVRGALGADAVDAATVAGEAGCSERTAAKHLKALVGAGHVAVREVRGGTGRPRKVYDLRERQ